MVFGFGIKAQQAEHYVEHVLIVKFLLTCQFVGRAGHEALQARHKVVNLSGSNLLYKVHYLKSRLMLVYVDIARHEKVDKTVFNFLVWKS